MVRKTVDAALDEAVEGKARLSVIEEIQIAVEELARKLDQVVDAKERSASLCRSRLAAQ